MIEPVGKYGPWALVTGASSGLGEAFALNLAQKGFHLILTARRQERLQALSSRLHSVQTRIVVADLARAEGRQKLLESVADLDMGLVICNAGVGTSGRLLDSTWEREQGLLQLNVEAVLELTYGLGKRLQSRGRGGLILVGSVLGYQGIPYCANYAASKAYVVALGEGLRQEWKEHGVEVLVAAPGPTQSEFAERAGLKFSKAAPAEQVAAKILNSLGRTGAIVPDGFGRFLRSASAWMGRAFATGVIGKEMKKMSGS